MEELDMHKKRDHCEKYERENVRNIVEEAVYIEDFIEKCSDYKLEEIME